MRKTRRCRPHAGFTLIELVSVIAILGIMAVAVGAPTLSYVGSIRSRAAASKLTGDIRYIQRVALNSGRRTWMTLNAGSNSYQLFIEDPSSPGKAGRLTLAQPLDSSTSTVQFGSGPFANVSIASVNINATGELEFDSFGAPYDANEAALTAAGTINLSGGVTISIQPVGGYVERAG